MPENELDKLRREVEEVNLSLLRMLNHRARLVRAIQEVKAATGQPNFDPEREQAMLSALAEKNEGPFSDETIRGLFKSIFSASFALMAKDRERVLEVSRAHRASDLIIDFGVVQLGSEPLVIADLCAKDGALLKNALTELKERGVHLIKLKANRNQEKAPAREALSQRTAQLHEVSMKVLLEVVDTRDVSWAAEIADGLIVPATHMYDYALLKALGKRQLPVLVERAPSATLSELLWAAEYIISQGNPQVILCETGMRSFAGAAQTTLDVSAIALLRQKSYLPVVVDLRSCATSPQALAPLARASLAAGAAGIVAEISASDGDCPHTAHTPLHLAAGARRTKGRAPLELSELVRFLIDAKFTTKRSSLHLRP